MDRPDSDEIKTKNEMSVYFDPRVKKKEAEDKEAEKQEAIQTIARAIGFFVKPVILMLLWNWLMPGFIRFGNNWLPQSTGFDYDL